MTFIPSFTPQAALEKAASQQAFSSRKSLKKLPRTPFSTQKVLSNKSSNIKRHK
jgi:hypothetical protein